MEETEFENSRMQLVGWVEKLFQETPKLVISKSLAQTAEQVIVTLNFLPKEGIKLRNIKNILSMIISWLGKKRTGSNLANDRLYQLTLEYPEVFKCFTNGEEKRWKR